MDDKNTHVDRLDFHRVGRTPRAEFSTGFPNGGFSRPKRDSRTAAIGRQIDGGAIAQNIATNRASNNEGELQMSNWPDRNPPSNNNDGGAAGVFLGILVGVLVIALLLFFLVMPGRFTNAGPANPAVVTTVTTNGPTGPLR